MGAQLDFADFRGQDQALGTSRGGCATKIHAVIDRKGRPLRFLLSGGQGFDGKAAVPLLKPLPPVKKLLADKAYDCAAFRDWLARRGTTPVIPNKINRRKPFPYNKRAYRHRNKIERMFCRLKDARRIATLYDKGADNFLGAGCLIAAIYF